MRTTAGAFENFGKAAPKHARKCLDATWRPAGSKRPPGREWASGQEKAGDGARHAGIDFADADFQRARPLDRMKVNAPRALIA